ncbi:hypothetical protein MNV49_004876 [Pseudohyphozyma bogoriensis]|nr:hypothetical protein MNV49_004876 [Pseudohyphozyma bogoriensis]
MSPIAASLAAFLLVSSSIASPAYPPPGAGGRLDVLRRSPLAAPATTDNGGRVHVPMIKRKTDKSPEAFARKAEHLRAKYGGQSRKEGANETATKRSSNSVSLTNYEDSEYYAQITVGTPASDFYVVVDTGSSDLILATSPCEGCESTTPLYTPSNSSTSASSGSTFSITYGSGSASGTVYTDTVSIAGYAVSKQGFAACDTMDNIVDGDISGLLGLGWSSIANSGATPLLENIANGGNLSSEVFSFAFKTYSETGNIQETAAGGTMVIGAVDTGLFSGEINWIDVVQPEGYWMIPLQGLSAQGSDLSVTADAVAIDTGTSLIGAPTTACQAVYEQLGGQAISLSGSSGYYSYPCSTNVNVTMTFGGVQYSIPSDNFNSGYVTSSGSECLGALFEYDTTESVSSGSGSGYASSTSTTPTWIVGDSFLNGVYSAFRFSPTASIGFATLGSGGSAGNGSDSTATTTSSAKTSTSTSSAAGSTYTGVASSAAKLRVLIWPRSSLTWGELEAFYSREQARLAGKYGGKITGGERRKRSVGTEEMNNAYADSMYYGTVSVGTPARDFEVILDTGSADLWLSTAPCTGCEAQTPLYDPSSSSTAVNTTLDFSIQYGSGAAAGALFTDVVGIAGFTVANQTFAAATTSEGVVSGDISGILGLAWERLASSNSMPLLQGLSEGGQFDQQMFGFAFSRWIEDADAITEIKPGGIMTIGGVNSSLYTGDFNWVPLVDNGTYWLIPLDGITVQGVSTGITDSSVAIDTGTSLIAGPSAAVTAIYNNIPGSQPVTAYPCATTVKVSMEFGGIVYDIDPSGTYFYSIRNLLQRLTPFGNNRSDADFNAGQGSASYCLGAFFITETGASSPDWIVGDVFLKNVYSAFRFSPNPAVGFASLSSNAPALIAWRSKDLPSSPRFNRRGSRTSTRLQIIYGLGLTATVLWMYFLTPHSTSGFTARAPTTEGTFAYATPSTDAHPYERHPIYSLMKDAKDKWEAKVAKQSQTLSQAIIEYRKRYRRDPPKGFDKWFNWAQARGVQLLDEYDAIADHVFPLLSLSPDQLRERIEDIEKGDDEGKKMHAVMRIRNGKRLPWTGADWRPPVTDPWGETVDEIIDMLPDMDAALLVDESLLPTYKPSSWDNRARTCLPDSNLHRSRMGMLSDPPPGPAFIADHYAEMDYCENPKTVNLHGKLLQNAQLSPWISRLVPTFAMSRTKFNGDILWPAPILYNLNPDNESSFLDKPVHKVVWRGSPDGVAVKWEMDWRESHRFRLLFLTNSDDTNNKRTVRMTKQDRLGHEYQVDVESSLGELNARYMNVRPTNEAVQCQPELCEWVNQNLPFSPKLSLEEMATHRYVMDVDGNAYSARFRTHLMSNQVVLKSTRYPEWYVGRIQPWLHYVPVRQDYSDLYNIMAFFDGGLGPDREGHHDDLAEEIATAGREWAETNWRIIDIKAYLFRLLLEYGRLFEEERTPAYLPNEFRT